jgi:hypothetical protein
VDERPANEMSYAASNLVKPDLTSRRPAEVEAAPTKDTSANLRAERQVFPPTPPPENEFAPSKPIRANTVAGMGGPGSIGGRPGSIRGRDDRRRDPSQSRDGRDRLDPGAYGPPPRRPTVHGGATVPEPRRAYSARAPPPPASVRSQSTREPTREPSRQRQPPPRARTDRSEYSDEMQSNPYNDDLYDLYGAESREPSIAPSRRGSGPGSVRRGPSRRAPPSRYEEDDDYASDAYEGSSFDEDEFEMLDARSIRSGASRRPEVKKVRGSFRTAHQPEIVVRITDRCTD